MDNAFDGRCLAPDFAWGIALFDVLADHCVPGKTRERFMGVGQVLTMPLFFASSAIYPTSIMPHWLQVLVHFNPLTYQIDGLRAFLLPDLAMSPLGVATDLLVMGLTLAALVAICARTYPNIVR